MSRSAVGLFVAATILAGMFWLPVAALAEIQPEHRKELAEIKKELGKVSALLVKKKADEAETTLTDCETRLKKLCEEAGIEPDDKFVLATFKLLEQKRTAVGRKSAESKAAAALDVKVGPVPDTLRADWNLSPFYQKHVDLDGFPLLSSAKVSDAALREAAYLIEQMLAGRDDVRQSLIESKIRFVVMSPTEMTTDVPEHSDLTPKDYWDRRARGLGATLPRPAVSCGEENLLNLKGDRYPQENILIHEFAHSFHELGLNRIDERFDARLRDCYDAALQKGLWKNTYAATNHKEYFAEAVQSYFDCNNPPGPEHNEVNTREELARYDPDVYELIDEAFRQTKWRYVRYDQRRP